ncbi:MAG: DUF4339 domain-containing protein [Bdellovibrio sp.]|nr:MAG: DUF4339 domain-containing protein [Bdellovibrio sp.]
MWYYFKRGKAGGPVSSEAVAKKIRLGELGPYDMLRFQGQDSWVPLIEIPDFQECFDPQKRLKTQEAQWVLLLKNQERGTYLQKGPYSTSVVREMLSSGKISHEDYIWKEGMKEWYQIAFLEPFQSVKGVPEEVLLHSSEDSLTSEELLDHIVERKDLEETPPKPFDQDLEAENLEDLTDPKVYQKVREREEKERLQRFVKKRKRHFLQPSVSGNRSFQSLGKALSSLKKNLKPFMWHGLFFGGTLLLFIIAFLISSRLSQIKKEASFSGRVPPKKASAKKIIHPPSSKGVPKRTLTPRAATYLKLRFLPKQKELVVLTDGTDRLGVLLVGRGGQILEKKSVYQEWSTSQRRISLKSFPEGLYRVEVQSGKRRVQRKIFLGQKNKAFLKRLRQHKKQLSYWHQQEKWKLIQMTKELLRHIQTVKDLKFRRWFQKNINRSWKGVHQSFFMNLKSFCKKILDQKMPLKDRRAQAKAFYYEAQRLSLYRGKKL